MQLQGRLVMMGIKGPCSALPGAQHRTREFPPARRPFRVPIPPAATGEKTFESPSPRTPWGDFCSDFTGRAVAECRSSALGMSLHAEDLCVGASCCLWLMLAPWHSFWRMLSHWTTRLEGTRGGHLGRPPSESGLLREVRPHLQSWTN